MDFRAALTEVFTSVGLPQSWLAYLKRLADGVTGKINQVRAATGAPIGDSLTEHGTFVIVGGFYRRSQELAHILFSHRKEGSAGEPRNYEKGFSFPFGSPATFDLIKSNDRYFSKYASPERETVRTLVSGIERVKNDILAHCDQAALAVDEATCRLVGGDPQIATVTLADGFRWVRGFEPKTRAV